MLAKGVELEFGSARELVVRLAHDRMMAAEMVKTNLLVQCASAILSAVAASSAAAIFVGRSEGSNFCYASYLYIDTRVVSA